MVDRNRNGVDDSKEKKPRPRLKPKSGNEMRGLLDLGMNKAVDPLRQVGNFVGDFADALQGRPQAQYGQGQGDKIFGQRAELVNPGTRAPGRGFKLGNRGGPVNEPPVEDEMTLADYLAQAASMLGGSGGGGVNYDPQRQTLRSNAAENDARLEAMYRQLRGSIEGDAPALQQAYQQAQDSTAANNSTAQAQAQAATAAANAQNSQVLANLGIQEAAGNQIIEGRDLNTQTAQNVGDMAARGQAAGDRLASNKATALAHNQNIASAAGLEGNLQRAGNQARLQALLAEIDMAEQQANASRQDDMFAQKLGLAQELIGFDRYNQERIDGLQQSAAELAAEQRPAYDPNAFWNYIAQLGNIDGLAPLSEDPNEQVRQLDLYRKIFQG